MTIKPYHKMTLTNLQTEARSRGWTIGYRETKADLVRQLHRDDHLKQDRLEAVRESV